MKEKSIHQDHRDEKRRIFLWLSVAIPLVIGGAWYYLFCPNVAFVRGMDQWIGTDVRRHGWEGFALHSWMRCYGLDFLWAYSFSCGLYVFTEHKKEIAFFLPVICGSILEILQSKNMISGTGDGRDVFAEILGTALAVFVMTGGLKYEKT